MQHISQKIFLGVIITSIFLTVSLYTTKEKGSVQVPEELSHLTFFELGQYYFNSDDDPSGPYDIQKAQYFYEQAVNAELKVHEAVWYQLGRTSFIQGEFDVALAQFAKQQKYFGDVVPGVYYMIGLTYAYKAQITEDPEDWQRGEENFEKYIEYAPSSPWPRVDLAWIYFSQGKYEKMKPTLEKGLSNNPDNPWLLNMYGLALLNTGERERALSNFRKAYAQADVLTDEDWGKVYPGNNPDDWMRGITEFKEIIQKNIGLTSQ